MHAVLIFLLNFNFSPFCVFPFIPISSRLKPVSPLVSTYSSMLQQKLYNARHTHTQNKKQNICWRAHDPPEKTMTTSDSNYWGCWLQNLHNCMVNGSCEAGASLDITCIRCKKNPGHLHSARIKHFPGHATCFFFTPPTPTHLFSQFARQFVVRGARCFHWARSLCEEAGVEPQCRGKMKAVL